MPLVLIFGAFWGTTACLLHIAVVMTEIGLGERNLGVADYSSIASVPLAVCGTAALWRCSWSKTDSWGAAGLVAGLLAYTLTYAPKVVELIEYSGFYLSGGWLLDALWYLLIFTPFMVSAYLLFEYWTKRDVYSTSSAD